MTSITKWFSGGSPLGLTIGESVAELGSLIAVGMLGSSKAISARWWCLTTRSQVVVIIMTTDKNRVAAWRALTIERASWRRRIEVSIPRNKTDMQPTRVLIKYI